MLQLDGGALWARHKDNGGKESWGDIARTFSPPIEREAVRSAVRRWARLNRPLEPFAEPDQPPAAHSRPLTFAGTGELTYTVDDRRALLRAYLGASSDIQARPAQPFADVRKVMVIADLHGHPSADILGAAIAEQPDLIVLAGDLLDSQEVSAHPAMPAELNKRTKLRTEIANVRAWIEMLLEGTTARISCIRGNHDDWAARKAAELLPIELLDFWQDPFDVLFEGFPADRVERACTRWEYHMPDSTSKELGESQYMLVLGDCIISHMNHCGSKAGDAVNKLSLWVDKWRDTLGLRAPALLVQAHVHRVCLIEHDSGNKVLVEPGAAFEPRVERYKTNYQPKWSPASIGCLVFEQRQIAGVWYTDRSTIRLIRPHRGLPPQQ